MIGAVHERIEKNAAELFTPDEIKKFEAPAAMHEYVAETPDGFVTAVRTQHRVGKDGSGGGFKITEVGSDMSPQDMLRRNREHSLGLATLMTLKGDVIDMELPGGIGEDFGGAKGEMYVPVGTLPIPERSSRDRINAILADYVSTQAAKGVLGVGIDRHAPDMNTGAPDMDRMAITLGQITGDSSAEAAFSGKSIENGGLEGREIATAQGLIYTLENHLEELGLDPKETTVAIQGAGNVGYHFARLGGEQLGLKIVGISDRFKAVVTDDARKPILVDETVKFENREIASWEEQSHHALNHPDDLLELPVDVFVFAAAPDVITKEKANKDRLKAKIILEGANNPMDSDAVDYYSQNGVSILPGIQGNAGGFAASNMEYNQGITGVRWDETAVLTALKKVMKSAYEKVRNEAGGDPYKMVDAAYRAALKTRYDKDRSGLYVPSR